METLRNREVKHMKFRLCPTLLFLSPFFFYATNSNSSRVYLQETCGSQVSHRLSTIDLMDPVCFRFVGPGNKR